VRFFWDTVERHSCSRGAGCTTGSSGFHSWTESNTRERFYMCNIKTNQALSATPHLKPPLRAVGWACGGNETMVLFGPPRQLDCSTPTTASTPECPWDWEWGGGVAGSPPNQLKGKLSSWSVCACDSCTALFRGFKGVIPGGTEQ